MRVQLSVVIPAYNEERRLPRTLRAVTAYLTATSAEWEVLVVDDGSADATAQAVHAFHDDRVRLIRWPVNRGKGHAVRIGVLASRGDRVLMCDADNATSIEQVELLHKALDRGAWAAIGSRALPQSQLVVRQSALRETCGRFGNALIQLLAVPGIQDTQCGFKLYDGPRGRLVFQLARVDGWCSDAEVLHLFHRLGLEVAEIPVRWSDQEGSKLRPSGYLAGLIELGRIRRYHHSLPPLDQLVVPAFT
ncbi:glycosyltransferase [Kribbella solani]|uniref:dolichyl-phosphate beta-glucosyltransferase n=1 Tax=Kribbella solani TaxID=236067 RepID=A0A841DT51_9ACTN|nr:glycosyltransferase involved in cell wall biosynthesis [Kribbella solani]